MTDARFRLALVAALHVVALACGAGDVGIQPIDCDDLAFVYNVHPRESAVESDLVAVAVNPAAHVVVAVTNEGRLVARADGQPFRVIEHPPAPPLRAVAIVGGPFCDPGVPCWEDVIAVGDAGIVLRSVDSGERWEPVDIGTTADLRGVTFIRRRDHELGAWVRTGIIVGDGVIFRSEDAGETWTAVEGAPVGSLRAIAGNEYVILAVGDDGLALSSSDEGRTWEVLELDTDEDLRTVVLAGKILATTSSGTALQLDDGGERLEARAPLAGFVHMDAIDSYHHPGGLWALYLDGQLGPWPEEAEESDRLVLPSRPIAAASSDRAITLVGEAGSVSVIDPHVEEVDPRCVGTPGRPLVVAGCARTARTVVRDDWVASLAPRTHGLDEARRGRLAEAWARDGALEHASIASFARWILELVACGAPAALVEEAQRALNDEIEHARLCYGLATAYAGRSLGPGPLVSALAPLPAANLSDLAVSTFLEGCVNETIAAVQAGLAAALCVDPEVRRVLARIAADETRHAALAWRALAWALESGRADVRQTIERALDTALARAPDGGVDDAGDRDRGRLSTMDLRAAATETLRAVVVPRARQLLKNVEG